jgi:hypothetical protein
VLAARKADLLTLAALGTKLLVFIGLPFLALGQWKASCSLFSEPIAIGF